MKMREAKVLFPLKEAGVGCTMNRLSVQAYPDSPSGKTCCVAGNSDEVKRLLGYIRYGEGIDTVDLSVVVHFDSQDFSEDSFGLALAVADKRARYGCDDQQAIVATGVIGVRGAVTGVESFADKVALAVDTLVPGDLFLFPSENRGDAPEGLAALGAKGVAWRAAAFLDELSDLWGASPAVTRTSERRFAGLRRDMALFAKGLVVGFLLILGLALGIAVLLDP